MYIFASSLSSSFVIVSSNKANDGSWIRLSSIPDSPPYTSEASEDIDSSVIWHQLSDINANMLSDALYLPSFESYESHSSVQSKYVFNSCIEESIVIRRNRTIKRTKSLPNILIGNTSEQRLNNIRALPFSLEMIRSVLGMIDSHIFQNDMVENTIPESPEPERNPQNLNDILNLNIEIKRIEAFLCTPSQFEATLEDSEYTSKS